MTTKEILELATLDALGLLEDDERREFERAFRQATPSVQRQVRDEQMRLTGDAGLLPDVEPASNLRDRVIARVRDAMQAVADRTSSVDVLGRIGPSIWSLRFNVSPLWRAACIGFATATVVLLTVTFTMQREYRNAMAAGASGEWAEWVRNVGPDFEKVMFSPTAQHVSFSPADESTQLGSAALFRCDDLSIAFLFWRDLPQVEGDYRLVLVDDNGNVGKTIATFQFTPGRGTRQFECALQPGVNLAILAPRTDKPLLISA